MAFPESNLLAEHLGVTLLVVSIHVFAFWYATRPSRRRPLRAEAERRRLIWFLATHCFLLATALNLNLLSRIYVVAGAAGGLVMLMVVPLLWWYAKNRTANS